MQRVEAEKIYNTLNVLNESLIHSSHSTTMRDGSWERFNTIMSQLATAYSDPVFNDYLVKTHSFATMRAGESGVYSDEFMRKVYGGTLYLYTQYLSDFTAPPSAPIGETSAAGNTYVTQHAEQSTEVSVQFNVTLMQLSEKLTKAETIYSDKESKENKFIQKMKNILPVAKDSLGIITTILKTAHEFNITPEHLLKIFS